MDVENETNKSDSLLSDKQHGQEPNDAANNDSTPRSRILRHVKSNLLLISTLVGVIFGIGLGFGVRQLEFTQAEVTYLAFPGELFLRALKMIILPLIVSSIVTGLAGMDAALSGRLGLKAMLYYLTTTVLACATGIIMTAAIRPGVGADDVGSMIENGANRETNAADSFMDLLRNMIPENIIQATVQQYMTTRINTSMTDNNVSGRKMLYPGNNSTAIRLPETAVKLEGGYHDGLNVIGIITFSALFGIFLGKIKKEGETVNKFFIGFNVVIMRMVSFIMLYSPVGIAFLIAGKIAEVDRLEEILEKLGLYVATVLTGTLIHGFVTLTLLYFVTTRKNPFKFIAGMSQALFTAWATASSSATLPVTFKCMEEKNKVDKRVTRFMLPVGATVNMDGGAIYEAISAIFIAQMHGFPVNFGTILTISATATASSIGAAGVPHVAAVTIVLVLQACGLPVTEVPLLLAVDWLLDRFRTMVNVFGDAVGAGIVAHLSRKELESSAESTGPSGSAQTLEGTNNSEESERESSV